MNRAQWFDRLHDLAPCVGDLLLHTLAGVLTLAASRETLLLVADALDEASEARFLADDLSSAAELDRLTDAFRTEATARTP